ncbi:MAG: 4Fe-4S binding protein [Candidatus Omnitrophica bacterium]|nr:4Fe-4S binding protein [Candidatus Omnitrophota bacterium]MBU1128315.1 4Fe-4S binding protein [Candidatus Omnitrophota bacterium]MBU1657280.1 4Fe-4S binding protein [Candidatus Omnitrophota bacterium]MBU1784151.1 4Fe-4S binding protein [Candidatus Omnitrophota bacterium]MBU1851264.1 4Fe-4S binding protein [Candidatus Omnitrophota bacterium]
MKKGTGIKQFVIARRCFQVFFLLLFVSILTPAGERLADILPARFFLRSSPLMVIRISIGIKAIASGAGFAFIILLLTMVFGRFFCGWVCPMGTVIDCAGALKKKRKVFTDRVTGWISSVKFYILGLLILLAAFSVQTRGAGDPMVIMARVISLYIIPAVSMLSGAAQNYFTQSWLPLLLFVLICCASAVIPRSWCRVLCPLGALYALMSRFALLERVATDCSDCKVCPETCRMGAIKDEGNYVKSECVLCMDCVYSCPRHDVKFAWHHFWGNDK